MASLTNTVNDREHEVAVQVYVKEFLDLLIRRKWMIVSFTVLGLLIGGVVAWFQKDTYRSITVILVEQQKIHENYVPSVVGGSAAERVSTITQQVLSRTNLQKVIDEFNLFPETIKSQGYEPVIDTLRKNVQIETKGRGGQLEAFTISFAHHDPMIAMKVTAKLASQYIDENIKIREQFIEGATEFLEQELIAAKQALDEKERALSELKLQYSGELPGQLETNLRTLDRLQEEKNAIQESINGLNTRLELLQKSIRDYEAMAGTLMEFSNAPFQGGGPIGGSPLGNRIAELKRELTKLSGEYTDAYPDVISLKTQIANLEKELDRNSADSTVSDMVSHEGDSQLGEMDKPVFDPYLAELNNSRDELKVQLVTLRARLQKISDEMGSYQGRIERTPIREQELLLLERDYGNMQENYQRLHEKRLNARISENLDKRQKGERFRILDPANLPIKPEGLPRALIVLGGFVVGAGLGGGLAFLLELLSPTFRRSEDAEVSLGLPTLATIPNFQMAYGKSMKMLAGNVPNMNGGNGNPRADANGHGGYFEAELPRRSLLYRKKEEQAFPAQLNLVTKWRPQSIVAEQYRVAATRLDLLMEDASSNVVLVTSAMKGEGKTSTSSNLAYTLARDLDEPTLLIDCDFKCPNTHNVFALKNYPGVADYLAGEAPLEACLQQVPDMPLWCMTVGDVENNAVSLSKLQNLSSIIDAVKSRYRFIILDGPPILPLADINLLSGLASVVLMVVRSGSTPKDVVQKAVEMIHHSGPTRLVLTDAWAQGVPYYVRHGYSVPYALSHQG